MVRKNTYRLEAEGFQELERQFQALGAAGEKALDNLKAKMPEFADAAERARARAEAARRSLEEAARVDFRNLQASLDPAAAAMARAAEGAERVHNALKLGVVTQDEATAVLDRLRRQYEEVGRAQGGFNDLLGVGSSAARMFGVSLTAAGIYTLGRRMMESTDEGKRALSDLGGAFRELSSAVEPVTVGIVRQMGFVARSVATVARGVRDAVQDMKSAGTANDILTRESGRGGGFEPPSVEITGPVSVLSSVPITPGVSSFRGAVLRGVEADASAAQKAKEEIANALKELDETDAFFHQEKMKRLHDEVEAAKQAVAEESREREQAMRALDETDRYLSAEKMRRFHEDVAAQKRAANDLAAQDARNMQQLGNDVVRLIGSLGVGSGSGNAALGQGLALMFSSLGGSGASGGLSRLFGSGAAANDGIPDVAMTPQVFGSNPGGFMTSGMLAKAAPFLSSGMQGFQMGSVMGGITGGNSTNGGIGGGLGGMAGMAIGGPAGAFIGSLLGGALGGMFGPSNPSNFTAVANFGGGLGVTSMGGDKPNQATTGLAGNAAAQIEQAVASLKGYGAAFSKGLDFLAIGEQRNSYFRLAGDTSNRTIGSTGDANDLALQALKALLPSLSGGSANLGTALSRAGSAGEFASIGNFVVNVYDVLTKGAPAATEMETAMKGLVKTFSDNAAEARRLGLDVTAMTRGAAKGFNEDVRLALLGIEKPLLASLELWKRDAQARLNTAASIGGDVGQVAQLNAAMFRQMREPQISALTGLQNSIGFGSFSAAAPSDQYFATLSQYNAAKSSALGGGDTSAFVSAAQNLLPIARNFLGTSAAYGDLSRDVSRTADILKADLNRMPDLQPVTQAISLTGAATVQSVDNLSSKVDRLADEQQRTNAVLLALSRRVA